MGILGPLRITDTSDQDVPTTSYDRLPGLPCIVIKPGETIRCASQQWQEAKCLITDVAYVGKHHSRLRMRFFARDDLDHRLQITFGLIPHVPARLALDLRHLNAQTLFLPRSPGILKATCLGQRIDLSEIDRLEITLEATDDPQIAFLSPMRLSTDQPFCPIKKQTLVDSMGQLCNREWSSRTADTDAMVAYLKQEASTAAKGLPKNWSHYGGSRDHQFEASRFFRTHHDGKRWWLVDPDGNGFFSAGLDCVRDHDPAAIVPGTEELYEWLPKKSDPDFPECLGDNPAWSIPTAAFGRANLIRAFGDAWRARWMSLTKNRLQRWRFNTIGNWSDDSFISFAQIPYVINLHNYPSTRLKLYRDLPDVFAPEFAANAKDYAAQIKPRHNDPYLIGYFMANEPQWAFGSANLASEMLEDNPGTHSRKAFARHLAAKYLNDIQAWTATWGIQAKTFNAINDTCYHRLHENYPGARADLDEFSRMLASRFSEIPAKELKKADPNHLNLGLRFAWLSSDLLLETAKWFDVFSINCYQMLPDFASIERIVEACEIPVIIGEFHFGALDAGLMGTGLRAVDGQVERGIAYRRYVESAAAHPAVVGCHYFNLNDQPGLGRFDGEAWNIGFVDVCHRPYQELTHATTITNERIYKVVDKTIPAFAQEAKEVERIAF